MPSLPVNNQSLKSNEDAYRRYFGALKQFSSKQSRIDLCKATSQICLLSFLASIPNFVMLYFRYQQGNIYKDHKLFYVYYFTQSIITFLWCLTVIYVIFHHNHTNFRVMTFNAFMVSSISLTIAELCCYFYHDQNVDEPINIEENMFKKSFWRMDSFYLIIFKFPLTLYFSILMMYFSEYCCSSFCTFTVTSRMDSVKLNKQYREQLIQVPDDGHNNEPEVFETDSITTGPQCGLEAEVSIVPKDEDDENGGYELKRYDSTDTVSWKELEKAARKVVTRHMTGYCIIFVLITFIWFLISTIEPEQYKSLRVVFYGALLMLYSIGKALLKRRARAIDTAIIIPNFSFEIITEILMSSLYWCNFRMFVFFYDWNTEHDDHDGGTRYFWQLAVITIIHLLSEIFQDSIRMNAGYFNITAKYFDPHAGSSNINQWKVRGAIDTCIRFIICVYSIIFVTIRYPTQSFPDFSNNKLTLSAILNYSVFCLEMIYFGFVIFKPKCAGKVAHRKHINIAEPLMRMYNANRTLFLGVFSGSMVVASLLVP